MVAVQNEDSTAKKKYLVDGQFWSDEQILDRYNSGKVNPNDLASREKIALDMIDVIAPRGKLLDVGCYVGNFLANVQLRYPEVDFWGVDYFTDNIRIAKLLYPDRAERFSEMSVYSLDFADDFFDCITFKEVIEHIDRPVDALREINRVLKPGGYLILSTPNANSRAWELIPYGMWRQIKSILGRDASPSKKVFFEEVEWNRHIYSWTASTLHTLLVLNGFEYIDQVFYYNSFLERLIQEMGDGLIFLVRKANPAPTNIV